MMEKPILFNTEMVRAILDGRKTQTRRLIKRLYINEPYATEEDGTLWISDEYGEFHRAEEYAPYKPGDLLYVRETWARPSTEEMANGSKFNMYVYRADYPSIPAAYDKWRPSIHMPKEAARIWLKVKKVKVQRLQEITNKDAKAEGVTCATDNSGMMHRHMFRVLWDSITDKQTSWEANPWVWAIEFERMEGKHNDG